MFGRPKSKELQETHDASSPSDVNATKKSGSYRSAHTPEPMPEEPTENMADVLEWAAFQEKLTDKVREYLKIKDWKALDILGNERVVSRITSELGLHWKSVDKAVRTIADEEREKRKPAA